jgi:hypothetical protein
MLSDGMRPRVIWTVDALTGKGKDTNSQSVSKHKIQEVILLCDKPRMINREICVNKKQTGSTKIVPKRSPYTEGSVGSCHYSSILKYIDKNLYQNFNKCQADRF